MPAHAGPTTSPDHALGGLLGWSLSLVGRQQFADAARDPQGKCNKIKNKKQRKKCVKEAKAHNGQDSNQPPPTPGSNVSLPVRATFNYPWFPNAWKQGGVYPYTNFNPILGYYDGGDPTIIGQQIQAMQYGGIAMGIASWWGVGHHTDGRVPTLLGSATSTDFK